MQKTSRRMGTTAEIITAFLITIPIILIICIPLLIFCLIFIIIFIVKFFYRLSSNLIKKTNFKLFSLTKYENSCIESIDFLYSKISLLLSKMDRFANREISYYNRHYYNARYCERCGKRLGRGRIKYCSICRPSGRSKPYESYSF